jgi:hypothetical protein
MRARTLFLGSATATAAGIAFAFAACSDTSAPPATNGALSPSFAKGGQPKPVKSVSVSPSSATVAAGATVQLTATASPPGTATSFTWASSNTAVASVSSTGLVTGVAAGSATISASAGGKSGAASITVPGSPPPPPPGSEVLVGAGDIAVCGSTNDDATANLLAGISGTVFTLGDNAYPSGSSTDYANCYNPSWGRVKSRTMPTPGNHEYQTTAAAGYFAYFGNAAGDPSKGYYSYNLGDWHVIVLNSNSACGAISCAAGSAQEQWLRADLAANTKACTLAYWHHPRFNSGLEHGNLTAVGPFWNALYEYGAEIVLNGHEHLYERFAPQTPNAAADPARGIRQFTVGTGGAALYAFSSTIQPNSERRNNTSYGVLKLTLKTGGYDWEFIPATGSFTDSGSGTCH